MLIVLEGVDGVGKSTIARKLARILNARIIHCTKDTPNDYHYFHHILDAATNENVIADRFCYGQFVYQAPEDRKLSKEDLYHLETSMLAHGAKVIYVTAQEKTIEERLNKRNETPMYPVKELMKRFDEVMGNSTLQIEIWRT
nr:MAG TPA: TMPK protein [Caudoviricetes sp.]